MSDDHAASPPECYGNMADFDSAGCSQLARLVWICVAAGSAAEADQADAKAAWLDGYLAW